MLQKFRIRRRLDPNLRDGMGSDIIVQDTATSFEALVQNALSAGLDLSGAILAHANFHHFCCAGARLAKADLTGASLVYAHLTKSDLRGACLVAANLAWADFSCSDLSGALLTATNLAMTCLNDCTFDDADLCGANLWRIRVYTGEWSESRLRKLAQRSGLR